MTRLVNEIIRDNMSVYEENSANKRIAICGSCLMQLSTDDGQTTAHCENCQTIVAVRYKEVA